MEIRTKKNKGRRGFELKQKKWGILKYLSAEISFEKSETNQARGCMHVGP